ncbi:MAG: sigma-70 family RNA polymerase sigma factor [Elusimicrobia bacterium]|nr:sigma-70 family RNA polymerase sigma factor [Elusimicrobiota bacterium]
MELFLTWLVSLQRSLGRLEPFMIERFIKEYAERGFQFAYHLCGNPEEAKELVQEALVKVMLKWRLYDQSQPLENWFLTILRNVYYDGLKRYERRHSLSLDASVGGDPDRPGLHEVLADRTQEDLTAQLERQELRSALGAALSRLKPEHRAIITLCDMEGLGYEEIAAVLDCPLGTVRSRLWRARAELKKRLLEEPAKYGL